MNLPFAAVGLAITALGQVGSAPSADTHRPAMQVVHIQHGGLLVLDGKVRSAEELRKIVEDQNIYVLSDKGVALSDIETAMKSLPDHRVFLITEDRTAAQ